MTIPLNIDTPSGVAFTINKEIYVCSTGRVIVKIKSKLNPTIEDGKLMLRFLDAKQEVKIEVETSNIRSVAYQLLGIAETLMPIKGNEND